MKANLFALTLRLPVRVRIVFPVSGSTVSTRSSKAVLTGPVRAAPKTRTCCSLRIGSVVGAEPAESVVTAALCSANPVLVSYWA
eukprot:scaffold53216_cov44-Tisochrysis_lutea.AAC.1